MKSEYVEEDRGYTTPCWIWQGSAQRYGSKYLSNPKRNVLAHRFYWERANGRKIPEGLEIDHLCEVPLCVNPTHLEPVPHVENIRRGRATKLTVAQVREIKASVEMGTVLGLRFGVDQSTIGKIRNGPNWKDIEPLEEAA